MKRSLLLASIIAVLAILINHNLPSASVSAQKAGNRAPANADDREMAAVIKRLADRSSGGLVEQRNMDGGVQIDLRGRFQNVMLSKLDEDGDVAVGCVASLGEANAFFGRNLETGEKYAWAPEVPKYFADEAARHGMSVKEYKFYTDVIDNWTGRQASPESATISIVNNDGLTEGFNETTPAVPEGGNSGLTRGAQRLILFQAAADVWDGFLDSAVEIRIASTFDPLLPCASGGSLLGSAGANAVDRDFPGATAANTWHHIALANKLFGADRHVGVDDITAQFNVSIDAGCAAPGVTRWYYGLNATTPANTLNLFVVLLHEMGHGLGFSTFIDGGTGAEFDGRDDVFGRNAFDEDLSLLWSDMTNGQRFTSARNVNDVLWGGANVMIASPGVPMTAGWNAGNGRVELYTPNPFEGGSSMSHFNTAATPNLLMEPFITGGVSLDLDLTKQQMRDIGWFRDATVNGTADTITGVSLSGTAVIGTNKTISWTNNGGFNRNVTIELSTNEGATFPTVVASNIPNTGSFIWTVPNIPTANARLRVREHDFVVPLGMSGSNFSILGTTAATVSVSGRVTDALGIGLSKARVSLTDNNGVSRTALTSSFGYFHFDGVTSGQTYIVTVGHKRYRFTPQVLSVVDEVSARLHRSAVMSVQ